MSGLIAVAYLSTAAPFLTEADLESLLEDARAFNAKAQVTGALLLHDATFFQYFEGPEAGVEAVYARVRASRRHRGIVELLRESTPERQFSRWDMGFAHAPKSLILQLAGANWRAEAAEQTGREHLPPGVIVLMEFWHHMSRVG